MHGLRRVAVEDAVACVRFSHWEWPYEVAALHYLDVKIPLGYICPRVKVFGLFPFLPPLQCCSIPWIS